MSFGQLKDLNKMGFVEPYNMQPTSTFQQMPIQP